MTVPFNTLFTATDDDGAAGDVVREVIQLDGCTVYDGLQYGDQDGLLSDEVVTFDMAALCRIVAVCGRTTWTNPVVMVTATDCGGNTGTASAVLTGQVSVLCGRGAIAPQRNTRPGRLPARQPAPTPAKRSPGPGMSSVRER